MNMVANERTWIMITVSVTMSMMGNTATSDSIAFSLSSTEPAVSMR